MFDGLVNSVKIGFTFVIIFVIIIIIVAICRSAREYTEAQERAARKREEINRVKIAAKRWTKEGKYDFLQRIETEYQRLAAHKNNPTGPRIADIFCPIDEKTFFVTLDMKEMRELYAYVEGILNE